MSVCVCVWTKGRKNTFASPSRHYHIKDSFTVLFFSLSFSPSPVLLELELTWIRKSPCNVFINSQTLWHPTTSSLLPNTELFLHSSRWAPCGIRITKIIWTENWVHEQKKKNSGAPKNMMPDYYWVLCQGPLTMWDRFNLKLTSYVLFDLWGYKWNTATIPSTFLSAGHLKNWVEKVRASVSS